MHQRGARALCLLAMTRNDLDAGSLRALVANLGREAHFRADGQVVELVVQHAIPMEVKLPVVLHRADEAVALALEDLLDGAVRLAIIVRLHVVAAQRLRLLELLLDGAEGLVDDRRQLRLHIKDLLLLLHREVVVLRHPDLDHHAVAVALAVRRGFLRDGDMAARNLLRELLEVRAALGDVLLDPRAAVDILEDYFRGSLHWFSMYC